MRIAIFRKNVWRMEETFLCSFAMVWMIILSETARKFVFPRVSRYRWQRRELADLYDQKKLSSSSSRRWIGWMTPSTHIVICLPFNALTTKLHYTRISGSTSDMGMNCLFFVFEHFFYPFSFRHDVYLELGSRVVIESGYIHVCLDFYYV